MSRYRGVRLIELEWDEFEKKCKELLKRRGYYTYDSERGRHVLVPLFSEGPPFIYVYQDNAPIFKDGYVLYAIKRICFDDEESTVICYEPKEGRGGGE